MRILEIIDPDKTGTRTRLKRRQNEDFWLCILYAFCIVWWTGSLIMVAQMFAAK